MKTQEEIIIKAKAYAESIGSEDGTSAFDYIMGYNQCQEDNADKKYTEEAMLLAYVNGGTRFEENKDADKLSENFKELISLLNKQDNE
jgi:hypothetical protein